MNFSKLFFISHCIVSENDWYVYSRKNPGAAIIFFRLDSSIDDVIADPAYITTEVGCQTEGEHRESSIYRENLNYRLAPYITRCFTSESPLTSSPLKQQSMLRNTSWFCLFIVYGAIFWSR